jgi:hypothetical protein
MNQNQIPDDPRVGSQNAVHDEESVLRDQNAALREDNEDLRASALWWKALYEEAQRRCVDLESSLKPRVSSRVDIRFPRVHPSNPIRAARAHTTSRPL